MPDMRSLHRLWKRYRHTAPASLSLARERIRGQRGIEVGGPSQIFQEWYSLSPAGVTYPVYGACATLDNCDFAQSTTWAEHHRRYAFQRWKRAGRNYFCEGSAMSEIPDGTYDFLLSSHNLEHFANPVKTLREWQRVVRPGGTLILVLPHRQKTFDIGREATPVAHMLEDFARDMQEDDLTHVDEIVAARHRTGTYEAGLEEVLRTNFDHRKMHHHAFDEDNSRALLDAVGFDVLRTETFDPCHIILVAQFPMPAAVRATAGTNR